MHETTDKLFERLVKTCARLRGRDGCMWDRQQNHSSLVPFLVEETGEVRQAIEKKDMENLKEELGDLLYQIIFHSQIAAENGEFDIDDVLKGIIDKLVRRHTHLRYVRLYTFTKRKATPL